MGQVAAKRILQRLLERGFLETDGLSLWEAIRQACVDAIGALDGDLYVYDRKQGLLQRLEQPEPGKGPRGVPLRLGRGVPVTSDHIAARAFRRSDLEGDASPVEETVEGLTAVFAVPIRDPVGADHGAAPLAVVVLTCPIQRRWFARKHIRKVLLNDLLEHLGLAGTHANLRRRLDRSGVTRYLRMDRVLDAVLDTLCNHLGFTFAAVSLVDEYPPSDARAAEPPPRQIRTVRARQARGGTVWEASHSVDGDDIQADVLRTGRTEVIDRWDPRLDDAIDHGRLYEGVVRVFVPLGRIGTIEAGFGKHERAEVEQLLVDVLRRWAVEVSIALQNARLYERSQWRAESLDKLREFHRRLQAVQPLGDRHRMFDEIARGALDVLQADIALLYWPARRDLPIPEATEFLGPIHAGKLKGGSNLKPPSRPGNIVSVIAERRTVYLQTEARDDPLLTGTMDDTDGAGGAAFHKRRSFIERQNVRSFAGVPLVARGQLRGVLCLNYHERRVFGDFYEKLIELFAQEAADAIVSDETAEELTRTHVELARANERRRVARAMHDDVQTNIRLMVERTKLAIACQDEDRDRAAFQLREVEQLGWTTLASIRSIISQLSGGGGEGQPIDRVMREELSRFVESDRSRVRLAVAESVPLVPVELLDAVRCFLREALANALRHSGAAEVAARAEWRDGHLRLAVQDNGVGFDVGMKKQGSYGLTSMSDRITEVPGGAFDLRSVPGAGTTVWAAIPLGTKDAG